MFPMMYPWMMPMLPADNPEPPTIYSLLNSYVNYNREVKVKISDLAKEGRGCFFDFDYPLASVVSKETFETMILNHFLMRRIGYETVTAFKIALNVKLNEIMPMYNKLFSAINNWEIFEDGEQETRNVTDSRNNQTTSNITGTTNSSNTSDRRYSDTPQNNITDVQNGSYITDYNYDTDTGSSSSNTNGTTNSTDNGSLTETISRTPADKLKNYVEFVKEKQNIYTMIFKDLDVLFYQVI